MDRTRTKCFCLTFYLHRINIEKKVNRKVFLQNFNFFIILMISNLNQIKKVKKLDWQNFAKRINFLFQPYLFHTVPVPSLLFLIADWFIPAGTIYQMQNSFIFASKNFRCLFILQKSFFSSHPKYIYLIKVRKLRNFRN